MSDQSLVLKFQFEPGGIYTIGELRDFEKQLSAARQRDRDLSRAWRVPQSPQMKRWVKIREETYAIKLLADHKSYSDDARFHLKPFGYPNIDAEIVNASERFELQITNADAYWVNEDGIGQNGGYDRRLGLEALNEFGFVHGSGLMRREEDGRIVSGKPVRSLEEEFQACQEGLVKALQRKLRRGVRGCRLLVHAREYSFHTMDFTFEDVVRSAIAAVRSDVDRTSFNTIYFVDEKEDAFFAHVK